MRCFFTSASDLFDLPFSNTATKGITAAGANGHSSEGEAGGSTQGRWGREAPRSSSSNRKGVRYQDLLQRAGHAAGTHAHAWKRHQAAMPQLIYIAQPARSPCAQHGTARSTRHCTLNYSCANTAALTQPCCSFAVPSSPCPPYCPGFMPSSIWGPPEGR